VTKPLGVAVVGLGVGEQHLLAYGRTPGCTVRAIFDRTTDRMAQVIGANGQLRAAADFDEILRADDVDIVSIATHDQDHYGQVVASLRAGKHVFVEKPLCRTFDELSDVESAWRRAGRHLASNLVLRSAPLYRWLRDAIAAQELGEVYAVDGDYLYGRLGKITSGWRADVDDYSVMLGGAIHLVDLLLWLTRQRPASVTAVGNAIATRGTRFRYADFVSATFTFPSGLIARITANFGCVHRHQHVLRVFGTRATFVYDDRGARLSRERDGGAPPVDITHSSRPSSKGDLIPLFVGAIATAANRDADTQHEFDVIRACVSADRARACNAAVEIDYR